VQLCRHSKIKGYKVLKLGWMVGRASHKADRFCEIRVGFVEMQGGLAWGGISLIEQMRTQDSRPSK